MIAEERGGAPSASAMERLGLCAGSHQASSGIKEPESEAARSGSRIHGLVAGEQVSAATTEELEMAGRCLTMAESLTQRTFGHPVGDCETVSCEERLWSEGRAFSGKADLVITSGRRGMIVDYKTGRGEVAPPSSNQQLRALAVLVSEHWANELDMVGVAIVQPLVNNHPEVAWYDLKALASAKSEVYSIVAAAAAPDAKRVAGPVQCKYCPAKSRCPEADREVAEMTLIPEGIMALTAEQMSRKLDACKVAEDVIWAIREEARHRIENGEGIAGWEMKAGNTREIITNPNEVFSRFTNLGGTEGQFMTSVTIAKGKLSDALKDATGAKGKELKDQMERLLVGCVEEKQNAPSLVKTK